MSAVIIILAFFILQTGIHRNLHSFPTRRSSDLFSVFIEEHDAASNDALEERSQHVQIRLIEIGVDVQERNRRAIVPRSEEHTSELQSHVNLVCRLLLEKKKTN